MMDSTLADTSSEPKPLLVGETGADPIASVARPHLGAEKDGSNIDRTYLARNSQMADWLAGTVAGTGAAGLRDAGAVTEVHRTSSERVEQLAGLMSREVTLVRQSQPDSMSVVLRPDSQTELFLHLTRHQGQIEAVVHCERGDFRQLNSVWSELQQTLATQKVKLAPLQQSHLGTTNDRLSLAAGAGGNPDGSSTPRRQMMPEPESLDDLPRAASSSPSFGLSRGSGVRRSTTSRPGWETWA